MRSIAPIITTVLFSLFFLAACNNDDDLRVTFGTKNFYFINNSTSVDLSYQTNNANINIPSQETSMIGNIEISGGEDGYAPSEFFEDEISTNEEEDVFLYRNDNGINIEALKLSNNEQLNWIKTDIEDGVFHFTLEVTDGMIN
ncbi:MAG: hypothetical protein AAGJ93_13280 [Bacteroidota bacterium]